ncbi:hypothetical protein, conserved [Eimeria maxima]|uniref:Uncharacterized protein n=1 Tax=Eimeria maxima TaxID=5804 RepID=U6M343_EIMMA|nr:hypothetical protein, conserved [Eimeria maxima]CDJ56864.1 hypothetical protein, conserved [Eimeria maxima]
MYERTSQKRKLTNAIQQYPAQRHRIARRSCNEHHPLASAASQPRLPQYELLELANSEGQSHPLVALPAASLIQNAARTSQEEQLIEGGVKRSTHPAIVSEKKVASVDSVESLKSTFRGQEDLLLAETTSLVKVNQSLLDELEQLRQQLNAQRHSLASIRKPSNSNRTLLKTSNVEEGGYPTEDHLARRNCDSQAERQELQGDELSPAITVTTTDAPIAKAKQSQGNGTSECTREEMACEHALGMSTLLVQHTSDAQAAEQGWTATVSPRKTAEHLQHQKLHCQPGPTADTVCQLLWELLDRMNYFKLRLAPAQELETLYVADTHNRHRPQHPNEFRNWAGARILKNHRKHRARSVQPAASKRDSGTHLSVLGKSMGNLTKATPDNWLFNSGENTPQHIIPSPALQRISSHRIQRIRQLGVPPLATKPRGREKHIPAVKINLGVLGRRLSHAPSTPKLRLKVLCSRLRCLKMKKPVPLSTGEPADNCRDSRQPPPPSASACENGIIGDKQEARVDLPRMLDDPAQLHTPGAQRRQCTFTAYRCPPEFADEGRELPLKISDLKLADCTSVTERATPAGFSFPFSFDSSKKNVGLRVESADPKKFFSTSSITKRSCRLVTRRDTLAQDKYDQLSSALEQTSFQQNGTAWATPTELQKKVLDFQQVGPPATWIRGTGMEAAELDRLSSCFPCATASVEEMGGAESQLFFILEAKNGRGSFEHSTNETGKRVMRQRKQIDHRDEGAFRQVKQYLWAKAVKYMSEFESAEQLQQDDSMNGGASGACV